MYVNNEKGVFVFLVALLIPVLAALAMIAINFGTFINTKMKLQVTSDRAVYAGAVKLSETMNKIAEENWKIYKAFLKVDKNFGPNSQQSVDECKKRVAEMESTQDVAEFQNIEEMIQNGYADANKSASDVAKAMFNGAAFAPIYGIPGERLFDLIDSEVRDKDGDEMRRDVICGNIEGLVFDPNDVESKNNQKLLKYTYKNSNYVGLIGKLSYKFKFPFTTKYFSESIDINAVSAGQPFGGSIKRFALLADETDSVDEAVTKAKEIPLWYKPAMVPVSLAIALGGINQNGEIYFH